jgi:alpha-L-rhamnosidase
VAANLAKRVVADNEHIDVGLLGTKTLLNALSDNGYGDLAYRVAAQETFPSWGWWIVNGATTFYENWPLDASRDISMNHIMFGEINAWYFKGLGGIFPDEKQPGFKNVILRPHFPESLNHFKAEHEGPCGTIVSGWKRTGGTIEYNVSIPPNSTATLYLKASKVMKDDKEIPSGKPLKEGEKKEQVFEIKLKSGDHTFEVYAAGRK